ncbi:MAG: hypothetical protein LCH38_11625 [Proteobacteria bacterium]|nr:hypothetical protein [Pseudomonadota bacterium]
MIRQLVRPALLSAPFLLASIAGGQAQALKIANVTVEKFGRTHLCAQIGGQNRKPVITVTHNRGATGDILVALSDTLSNGRVIDHRSVRVPADPSGKTVIEHAFLAPCNTTGNTISNYSFTISAGAQTITKPWGRYDSAKTAVLP